MSRLHGDPEHKLREVNAYQLPDAIDPQDEPLSIDSFSKITGLIRWARLRYPNADMRRIDLLDERGLNQQVSRQLGTCSFVDRAPNGVSTESRDQEGRIWAGRSPSMSARAQSVLTTSGFRPKKAYGGARPVTFFLARSSRRLWVCWPDGPGMVFAPSHS